MKQKFDTHCHTKEGSIDAHVPIAQYISILADKGYQGMLVTDHDSYKGYQHYADNRQTMQIPEDFLVLKGIEYDTRNAGHFLVIMPEQYPSDFLTVKGMTPAQLERAVHGAGGILGPAHPYGIGTFAFASTRYGKRNRDQVREFDFVETYNGGTNPIGNLMAEWMATFYKKPRFGGSDAHREKNVGIGFTLFEDAQIRDNDSFIAAVKAGARTVAGGEITDKMLKEQNKIVQKLGIAGFWMYNKIGFAKNLRKLKKIRQNHLSCDNINKEQHEKPSRTQYGIQQQQETEK